MDIKNPFLKGDIHEEVYKRPSPGVAHQLGEVCQLHKAIYGLKQAPRAWFEKFSTVITSDDCDGIASLKSELVRCFFMKNLGMLRYFLGIEVTYSSKGYLLSQLKHIADLFECSCLTNNKIIETALQANVCYSLSDSLPLSNPYIYRTIVGSLIYLTMTQPDIANDVHVVIQFITTPSTIRWVAIFCILRYLCGTQFQSLLFSSTSLLELHAYSNLDWIGDPMDRKSTTGFCIFFGDSLISWNSKNQNVTSQSSTKAYYHAMPSTTCENV